MDETMIETYIRNTCVSNKLSHLQGDVHYNFRENFAENFSCAFPEKMLIEISLTLWSTASEEEQRNIVIHECCHQLNFKVNGKQDHGKEWEKLMMGANEMPYRTFWELKNKKKLYKVGCECLTYFYTKEFAGYIGKSIELCNDCNAPVRIYQPTSEYLS